MHSIIKMVRTLALGFVLLLMSLSSVQGTEDDFKSLLKLSLEDLMSVTITGSTLTKERFDTVPASVSVFSRQQIRTLGIDSLEELMNFAPGFQAARSSTNAITSAYTARGRRSTVSSAEILFLIDGERVDEARTGGSGPNMFNYPLSHIERVEFIKGSGSAVYGSNAMLGVVNIVTRTDVNELGIAAGSFNQKEGFLFFNSEWRDIAIDVFGRHTLDDGDIYRVRNSATDPFITTQDPAKSTDLHLKARWGQLSLQGIHRHLSGEDYFSGDRVANGINFNDAEFNLIAGKYEFSWWSTRSWLSVSYNQFQNDFGGKVADEGDFFAFSGGASSDAVLYFGNAGDSESLRTQWHNDNILSENSQVQWGVEGRHIRLSGLTAMSNFDFDAIARGEFPIGASDDLTFVYRVQVPSTRDILGVYVQYQRTLATNTHLNIGLRYDSFSGVGKQLTPRASLSHKLLPNHSIKLIYGEAFRAPSENELNIAANILFRGNMVLEPESVNTWEAIWLGQYDSIQS